MVIIPFWMQVLTHRQEFVFLATFKIRTKKKLYPNSIFLYWNTMQWRVVVGNTRCFLLPCANRSSCGTARDRSALGSVWRGAKGKQGQLSALWTWACWGGWGEGGERKRGNRRDVAKVWFKKGAVKKDGDKGWKRRKSWIKANLKAKHKRDRKCGWVWGRGSWDGWVLR